MSARTPPPVAIAEDSTAAIDKVRAKVLELTVQPDPICGHPFDRPWIKIKELKSWLSQNLGIVLDEIFLHDDKHKFPEHTDDNSKKCILVLAILLTIGEGQYGKCLAHFKAHNLVDDKLPISVEDIRKGFREGDDSLGLTNQEWKNMAVLFHEEQWRFCPLKLSMNSHFHVEERAVLPICRRKKIKKGGVAVVYQILVPVEFVDEGILRAVQNNPHSHVPDPQYGKCCQFALKVFDVKKLDDYKNEKDAYHGLRALGGMAQYLGSFEHTVRTSKDVTTNGKDKMASNRHVGAMAESSKNATSEGIHFQSNILLEYSELDLDEVFSQRNPPVFPAEIYLFWQALSAVAEALSKMHNLEIRHEPRKSGKVYHGWHADIKPANILSVEGKYKLADFGYAQFKEKTDFSSVVPPTIELRGGTSTFGAPERLSKSEVSQNVDTWSLGCVLSLAATWIVFGYQGIYQYQDLRADAFGKVLDAAPAKIASDPELSATHPLAQFLKDDDASNEPNEPKYFDFFHNGERVLPEVSQWHAVLRVSVRSNDTLTPRILDIIDNSMLRTDGKPPSTASEVWRELDRLLKTHKPGAMPKETLSVVDTLVRLDAKLPLTVENRRTSYSSSNDSRRERKVKRLSVQPSLMRTTHRSEHLGFKDSGKLEQTTLNAMRDNKAAVALPAGSSVSPWKSQEEHDGASSNHQRHFSLPALRVMNSSDGLENTTPPTKPPQNVINAYLRNKKNNFKGKDPYLAKYFAQGDRDIMFLVDNAMSMASYWDDAIFLLKVIESRISEYDTDGLDLRFTNDTLGLANISSQRKLRLKKESKFKTAMEKARPNPKDKLPVGTDMAQGLRNIFNDYLHKLESGRFKKFTLIVLTDGLWTDMGNDKDRVRLVIKDTMTNCNKVWRARDNSSASTATRGDKFRPVSIQFVQFGHDENAFRTLRHLDNELENDREFIQEEIGDVVDHEMFEIRGDVNKIILGSFDPDYDAIDRDADIASVLGSRSSLGSSSRSSIASASDMMPPPPPPPATLKETEHVRKARRSSSTSTITPVNGSHVTQVANAIDPALQAGTKSLKSAFNKIGLGRSSSTRSHSRESQKNTRS